MSLEFYAVGGGYFHLPVGDKCQLLCLLLDNFCKVFVGGRAGNETSGNFEKFGSLPVEGGVHQQFCDQK